jgi:hypothetical protein
VTQAIWNPSTGIWNPRSRIRNPRRGIRNPRSAWITLHVPTSDIQAIKIRYMRDNERDAVIVCAALLSVSELVLHDMFNQNLSDTFSDK